MRLFHCQFLSSWLYFLLNRLTEELSNFYEAGKIIRVLDDSNYRKWYLFMFLFITEAKRPYIPIQTLAHGNYIINRRKMTPLLKTITRKQYLASGVNVKCSNLQQKRDRKRYAAGVCKVQFVIYLSNSIDLMVSICEKAAKYAPIRGSLHTLSMIIPLECDLNVAFGQLNCLLYAFKNGSRRSRTECWGADMGGYMDHLKILHENRCTWISGLSPLCQQKRKPLG
ncbi:hypothetical protein AGLY_018235 [Aphis glycines]|uniref:Uncharacterized protein n=1 Tax=Aphis glycines TaxID=307491 RepID=A0A6G0SSL6_APHGL|nr:hypothetical protein AGLY_018235 [Aphis glycines]